MKRALVALSLMAGILIPAFVATVWLFGCCVLPFHRVMHRLVPLCRVAIAIAHAGDSRDQQPSTAPQDKQPAAQRLAMEPAAGVGVSFVPRSFPLPLYSPAAYRSFIALGAVRCDRDIGLHTLFAIFLI